MDPKPTRKDESYIDIHSIGICDLCMQLILVVGVISLVDIPSWVMKDF